jgi:hypothetical protein
MLVKGHNYGVLTSMFRSCVQFKDKLKFSVPFKACAAFLRYNRPLSVWVPFETIYCHVFWVPWLNKNGFWIVWLDLLALLLQLLLITINYNSSQLMTTLGSLHSLLDYECLLFYCDWLGSDLRVGHFFSFRCPLVNTPQLNTQSRLQSDWLTNQLRILLLYLVPRCEPNREHYFSTVHIIPCLSAVV